jgi:hypothetical protein
LVTHAVCLHMTTTKFKALWVWRFGRIVRRWWPVAVFIALSLAVQHVVLGSGYDVGGHAAGHLAGASAPFMASAVICVLVWATPAAWRRVDLLCTAGLWLAMTVLVAVGNLRVVNDLIDAGYSHAPTGAVPDNIADHSLANSSAWLAEVAALLLIASWSRRGQIGKRTTIVAVVITVIVPPWIIPGAGVIVVAIVRLVQHSRSGLTTPVAAGAIAAVDRSLTKLGRG